MKKIAILASICIILSMLLVPMMSVSAAEEETLLPAEWHVSSEVDSIYLSSEVRSGNYAFAQGYTEGFKASAYQEMTELADGTYKMTAYVKSSGGQTNCWIAVKNHGKSEQRAHIEMNDEWTEISLDVEVSTGKALVAIWTESKEKAWALVDDVTFTDKNGKNYLKNGDFEQVSENGMVAGAAPDTEKPTVISSKFFHKWTLYASSTNDVAYMSNDPHSGNYCGVHYGNFKHTISTFQELAGLPSGTYAAEVYVKCSDGFDAASFVVNADGKKYVAQIMPTAKYVKVKIDNIKVTKGTIDYSVWTNNPGGAWLKYDDFNVYNVAEPDKNLVMNGSFEIFGEDETSSEKADNADGADGAAGDKQTVVDSSSEESVGMEFNEEDEFDYDDVVVDTEQKDSEIDVMFIVIVGVIGLCVVVSIVTFIILLAQSAKKKAKKEIE